MKNFHIYQRNLPHWRQEGAVYFVTWRLHPTCSSLTPDERTKIVRALQYFENERYQLFAYVVMDDHVHVLLQPAENFQLQQIVHSWKSFTAHQLQRENGRLSAVWQSESFDRIVRDEAEWLEKIQYIMNNPLKRWPEQSEYLWVLPTWK
jgi:REP element-mobilizing transposase RayT